MSDKTFGIRVSWNGDEAKSGSREVVESFSKIRSASETASRAIDQAAMSSKQLAMATRQVPMQFTDIVTSLAAGQPPLMVLLQQGGQLKDTFGGIAPAAAALGQYVAGLVNPLTLSAAGAAAIAVAIAKGASESAALQQSLVMSGRTVGATFSDLSAASANVAESTGATRAAAAGAITALISTGRVAVGELNGITDAIVMLDRVGVQAIDDSVKQFEALGKSPVEASLKLNEQYRYLTESVYNQIKALEEQGRTSEAAALAQRTYADTMRERAVELESNLGNVERAWNGVKDAAKWAWDAMLNIGREDAIGEKLKAAEENLARLKENGSWKPWENVGEAELEVRVLRAAKQAQDDLAKSKADAYKADQAGIQWSRQGEQVSNNRAKREQEIARARQLGLEAGKSELEIQQRISQINEKYKDPKKEQTDREKSTALLNQYARENDYALEKLSRGNELALMTERQRVVAEALYRVEDDANKMRERVIQGVKSESEQKRALTAVEESLAAQKAKVSQFTADSYDQASTFEYGWQLAMNKYKDSVGNAAKSAERMFGASTQGMENMIVNWATKGKVEVRDFSNMVLQEFARLTIAKPIASAFSSLLSVGASALTGYFTGGMMPDASGQGSVQGNSDYVYDLHTGGMAGSSGSDYKPRDSSIFIDAPRYHTGTGAAGVSLAPGEVPAVLKVGEGVFTQEQMANLAPVGSMQQPIVLSPTYNIDARGADAGVDMRIRQAMAETERRTITQLKQELARGGEMAYATGRRR